MTNNLVVGVTSVAFSKNSKIVQLLNDIEFDKVILNTKGRRLYTEEIRKLIEICDILIVGLDTININMIPDNSRLKVISKFGVGLDNINLIDCKNKGIEVLHTKGINKRSVSEMTLGFMINLCRNLYVSSNLLKKGIWEKNGGFELSNKTVGIIGIGNIGKDLISLIKPFKCNILVNDIIEQEEYYKKNNLKYVTKEYIFQNADIITLHTPLTHSTKNLINSKTISKMKSSSFLINTARGELVNQNDLKLALINNKIAGAAIDTYEIEPPIDQELLGLENLINTPHIGGNSIEAVEKMGQISILNILDYLNNKENNEN